MKVGETLAGKYQVERVLGSGAMGVVVAARHVDLQQLVALKFMLPTALPDKAAADRFLREAQAAGRLRSEHVARVMDFGRLEGGAPYIVMEFLEGQDLEEILEKSGPFSPGDAALYVAQACAAMDEAHKQGIVHRDLKPQNLFLTRRPDGSPLLKVLDFGISKLQGDVSGVTATQSTTVMGSPAYMSPEQARSAKHVDARADIYSLGAILYQLLSGYLPFQADSVAGMLVAIVSEDPIPLTEAAPGVPPELAAVVMSCLQKNKDKRPQTARELGQLLAPFASQRTSLWDADTERVTGQNLSEAASPKAKPATASSKGEVVITTMQPSSRPNESGERASAKQALAAPKKTSPMVMAIAGGAGVGLALLVAILSVRSFNKAADAKTTADNIPPASAAEPVATLAPIASAAPTTPVVVQTPAATTSAASSPPAQSAVAPTAASAATSKGGASTHAKSDAGGPHASPSSSAKPPSSAAPAATGGLFDRPE